jgi:23S rRNA pseudouridine1911/1915/1917 synthase
MNDEFSHTLEVALPQAGMRLDLFLVAALPDLSRSRLKALIEAGNVRLRDTILLDPARKVRTGESIAVRVPPPAAALPEAEAIELDILYEDDQLIVLNKPAGMVVHPAPGSHSATLVNALLHHCAGSLSGIGGVKRPGIVHRLDKDTSGIMVAAKTDIAHHALSAQFARHTNLRAYLAVCRGVPVPPEGEIAGRIGRSPHDRKKMAPVQKGGKIALTRYRVIKRFGMVAALVECRLATGRTHQIRVHMASIGHPLVGDSLYGRKHPPRTSSAPAEVKAALAHFPRQALHAWQLGFSHPITHEPLIFQNDLPIDINELISLLERI